MAGPAAHVARVVRYEPQTLSSGVIDTSAKLSHTNRSCELCSTIHMLAGAALASALIWLQQNLCCCASHSCACISSQLHSMLQLLFHWCYCMCDVL